MLKRSLFLVVILVMAITLAIASCAPTGGSPATTPKPSSIPTTAPPTAASPATASPTPAPAFKWPNQLVVSCTGGTASAGYASMVAITNLLSQDTGVKTTVISDASLTVLASWIKEGKTIISHGGISAAQLMANAPQYMGRDTGPYPSRAFWVATKTEAGFMTTKNSPLKTPYDIKPGTRIVVITIDPFFQKLANAICAWGKVDPSTVTFVKTNSLGASSQMIIEGKADLSYWSPQFPQAFEVEASPGGLAWMKLDAKADPEGAERFNKTMDYMYSFGTMGELSGTVPSAIGVPSFQGLGNIATIDTADQETLYNLAKWFDQNYARYKDAHPWNAAMTIKNVMLLSETGYLPLCDGTVKYLKEKGLWTAKHEERRQFDIKRIDTWINAYGQAMKEAEAKGISVNQSNESWVNYWKQYALDKKLPNITGFTGL